MTFSTRYNIGQHVYAQHSGQSWLTHFSIDEIRIRTKDSGAEVVIEYRAPQTGRNGIERRWWPEEQIEAGQAWAAARAAAGQAPEGYTAC